MPVQGSGRVHKYLIDVGPEVPEGKTLDKLQLYLPDGTALDLTDLGGEPPEAGPTFNPRGVWLPGEYDEGDAVIHGSNSYYATATTSDEPGVTGAPLADGDQLETVWLLPGEEMVFDPEVNFTPDGAPFDDRETFAILYLPVLTEGHLQIGIESPTDLYVGYWAVNPSGTLVGTGQSDNSIGFDLDDTGAWYFQVFIDSGDPSPITLTPVLSAGATITPAPEANPWVLFA